MAKNSIGKALKVTLGMAAFVGAAAAAGIVYGLKKWSEDEDSCEIKITTGFKNGLHIKKTEDGKYVVDTKYDWASDPNFCDDESEEAENAGIVIDISGDKCCCDDEKCCCGGEYESGESCSVCDDEDNRADSCCDEEGQQEDTRE